MNKIKSVLFMAGISLALVFTFSCSSRDGGDGGGSNSSKECDAFDPADKFCYDGDVYDKCGGKPYDPKSQICEEGKDGKDDEVITVKCNDVGYNPLTQICQNNVIEMGCGSDWFNPNSTTHYCKNGTALTQYGSLEYEGQTYRTVVIDEQTWMAENLNYNAEDSKCNGSEANCDIYGRLYNWATAMGLDSSCNSSICESKGPKGICPNNWHIPSNEDWDKLMHYVDSTGGVSSPYDSPTAGRYLKATSGWNSCASSYRWCEGYNKFGFSALPGGFGNSDTSHVDFHVGYDGNWWSSSEYGNSKAYYKRIFGSGEGAGWYYGDKGGSLFSVRCLRD